MLLAPIGNPEPKGKLPFGYPKHFLVNGTHIEKTAFSYVRTFLENATAHAFPFA
jgi:hypothetical protein